MDLHYTHTDSKGRHTESQQLEIGKPLVASCERHRKRNQAATCDKGEGASAQTMGSLSRSRPVLDQTLAGPCRPFTRKAECAAKVAVSRSNEPEENDENELHDFGRHC